MYGVLYPYVSVSLSAIGDTDIYTVIKYYCTKFPAYILCLCYSGSLSITRMWKGGLRSQPDS